jgi:hypothetical protein
MLASQTITAAAKNIVFLTLTKATVFNLVVLKRQPAAAIRNACRFHLKISRFASRHALKTVIAEPVIDVMKKVYACLNELIYVDT